MCSLTRMCSRTRMCSLTRMCSRNRCGVARLLFAPLPTMPTACTRPYTHTHACTRPYTHTHACTRPYTHTHACTRPYRHMHAHAHTHIHMHAHAHADTCCAFNATSRTLVDTGVPPRPLSLARYPLGAISVLGRGFMTRSTRSLTPPPAPPPPPPPTLSAVLIVNNSPPTTVSASLPSSARVCGSEFCSARVCGSEFCCRPSLSSCCFSVLRYSSFRRWRSCSFFVGQTSHNISPHVVPNTAHSTLDFSFCFRWHTFIYVYVYIRK
jgi:hypothetical protein